MTKITDASGTVEFSYDDAGRLLSKSQKVGSKTFITHYNYDALGRVATMTYPSCVVMGYGYDAGRVTRMSNMQTLDFTTRGRAIKTTLGLPTFAIVIALIVLKSAHPVLPFFYLAAGWYLCNYFFLRVYKVCIMQSAPPKLAQLYAWILGAQLILVIFALFDV